MGASEMATEIRKRPRDLMAGNVALVFVRDGESRWLTVTSVTKRPRTRNRRGAVVQDTRYAVRYEGLNEPRFYAPTTWITVRLPSASEVPAVRTYNWSGVSPDFEALHGTVTLPAVDMPALVRERYDAGWSLLAVTRPDGTIAAAIDWEDGKRTWWASL